MLLRAHVDNFHEGVKYVSSIMQQTFTVLGMRKPLKKITAIV